MKKLAISLACALLVSGCTAVSGVATPIEDTIKVIQNKTNPKPTIILVFDVLVIGTGKDFIEMETKIIIALENTIP